MDKDLCSCQVTKHIPKQTNIASPTVAASVLSVTIECNTVEVVDIGPTICQEREDNAQPSFESKSMSEPEALEDETVSSTIVISTEVEEQQYTLDAPNNEPELGLPTIIDNQEREIYFYINQETENAALPPVFEVEAQCDDIVRPTRAVHFV